MADVCAGEPERLGRRDERVDLAGREVPVEETWVQQIQAELVPLARGRCIAITCPVATFEVRVVHEPSAASITTGGRGVNPAGRR